jgi:hypothetical protein
MIKVNHKITVVRGDRVIERKPANAPPIAEADVPRDAGSAN